MLTYQMKFNARVESILIPTRQMVIEYFDPHGGESLRLGVKFNYDATLSDLRQLIIDSTPHQFFHDRNEELKAIREKNIDLSQLEVIVGKSMEYNLPTYNNEII